MFKSQRLLGVWLVLVLTKMETVSARTPDPPVMERDEHMVGEVMDTWWTQDTTNIDRFTILGVELMEQQRHLEALLMFRSVLSKVQHNSTYDTRSFDSRPDALTAVLAAHTHMVIDQDAEACEVLEPYVRTMLLMPGKKASDLTAAVAENWLRCLIRLRRYVQCRQDAAALGRLSKREPKVVLSPKQFKGSMYGLQTMCTILDYTSHHSSLPQDLVESITKNATKAIYLSSPNPTALHALAILDLKKANFTGAKKRLRQAIATGSSFVALHDAALVDVILLSTNANRTLNQTRLQKAIDQLHSLGRSRPFSPVVDAHIAYLYARMLNHSAVIQTTRRLLTQQMTLTKHYSLSPSIRKRSVHLHILALLLQGSYDKAVLYIMTSSYPLWDDPVVLGLTAYFTISSVGLIVFIWLNKKSFNWVSIVVMSSMAYALREVICSGFETYVALLYQPLTGDPYPKPLSTVELFS